MGRVFGIPVQVVVLMIVVAMLAACLIRYTVLGRQIIAVGGNEKAARLAGIPVPPGQAPRLCHQRRRSPASPA